MVDNTIALQLKSPQLESPLNRMARGLQMQAYKAQADTAQQATAKNAMLNQAYAAALDPKSGAIDYSKAAAFLAANGGGAYAPDVLTAGAAATTAQTGADKGKFELIQARAAAVGRDISAFSNANEAVAYVNRAVQAGHLDPGLAQAIVGQIPQNPEEFPAWKARTTRALSLTGQQQLETKFDAQDFGSGQRTIAYPAYAGGGGATVVPGSTVAKTISPDAASSARTAANRLAFDQKSEVARALMEGVLPEAVGLGGPPAPSAGAGAPMGAPGGGGAPMAAPMAAPAAPTAAPAAPMAAPAAPTAAPAAPTAAPAAPAVGPNGAPLARNKPEAKRFGELAEKLPVAKVALKNATDSIDDKIALVDSIINDASLPTLTGGGTAKYKSTVQSFNYFDDGPNLADLQGQIDRLSSEGMFIRMQELRAASPTGSTGLAAQSNAEGQTLRESFAQLNQAQSFTKYKQELERIRAQLERTKLSLTNSFAAEFAPIRGGAAAPAQDSIINFEDLQ